MENVFYSPKIDNNSNFKTIVSRLLDSNTDTNETFTSYGLQEEYSLKVPKPIRCALHVASTSGQHYLAHYGTGVDNNIALWGQSTTNKIPSKVSKDRKLDCSIKNIVYAQSHFVYITFCSDLTLRVFNSGFYELSRKSLAYSVLSLFYDSIDDVILTGSVGFLQLWKLTSCHHKPPILLKEIKLEATANVIPWITFIYKDRRTEEFLALCSEAIYFINSKEMVCNRFTENRHPLALQCCVTYPSNHYLITGSKDGSIKAWSQTMHSLPHVGNFTGHTKEILSLHVHPVDPILISSAKDRTIRIWRLETFIETYRFNALEEILDLKILSAQRVIYTSAEEIKTLEVSNFFSLFSLIGCQVKRIARTESCQNSSRLLLVGDDDGVRLLSPVHGQIITMIFPIVNKRLIDVIYNPIENVLYCLLDYGIIMVFSATTNPCSTTQVWVPRKYDSKVFCITGLLWESEPGSSDAPYHHYLVAGMYDGDVCLLKGKGVDVPSVNGHNGTVLMLRAIPTSNEASPFQLASYGFDKKIVTWTMLWKEKSNQMEIEKVAYIDLDSTINDIAIMQNCIAAAMGNQFLIYRYEASTEKSKAKFTLERHGKDESHKGTISQICCCDNLGLFATADEHGKIKVWDTNNQLIKELFFDHSLKGICFGNARGDLLVGFQNNLYHIPAHKYLPQHYLKLLLSMDLKDDAVECSIQFNPILKFWFDPKWVPILHFSQINLSDVKREHESLEDVSQQNEDRRRSSCTLNKLQKWSQLNQRSALTSAETALTDILEGRSNFCISRNSTQTPNGIQQPMSFRNITIQVTNNAKYEIDSNATEELPEITSRLVDSAITTQEGSNKSLEMQTNLEDSVPKRKYWPCAPDGFIPNSLIRSIVKPRPPPLPPPVFKVKGSDYVVDDDFLRRAMEAVGDLRPLSDDEESLPRKVTWSSDESDVIPTYSSEESEVYESSEESIDYDWLDFGSKVTGKGDHSKKTRKIRAKSPLPVKSKKKKRKKKIENIEENKTDNETEIKPRLKPTITKKDPVYLPKVTKEEIEISTLPNVYQSLFTSAWFPSDIPAEPNEITKQLLLLIKSDDIEIVKGACKALLDINREIGLSPDLLELTICELKDLLQHDSGVVRHIGVKTLVALGENRHDVIMLLVPRIGDLVNEVKVEAIAGIKQLTGVDDNCILVKELKRIKSLPGITVPEGFDSYLRLLHKEEEEEIDDQTTIMEETLIDHSEHSVQEIEVSIVKNVERKKKRIAKDSGRTEVYQHSMTTVSVHSEVENEMPKKTEMPNQRPNEFKVHLRPDLEDEYDDKETAQVKISSWRKLSEIAPILLRRYQNIIMNSKNYHYDGLKGDKSDESLRERVEEEQRKEQRAIRQEKLNKLHALLLSASDSRHDELCQPNETLPTTDASKKIPIKAQVAETTLLEGKGSIRSVLLSTVTRYLTARRTLGEEEANAIVCKETIDDLRSLLDTVNMGNNKMLNLVTREALPLIMEIQEDIDASMKRKLQWDIRRKRSLPKLFYISNQLRKAKALEKQRKAVEKNNLDHEYQKRLIKSPIQNLMVPGVRGERIIESIIIGEDSNSQENKNDTKNTMQTVPARLGNHIVSKSEGFSKFGKMKLKWTSKTPRYDMDHLVLQEQKFREKHAAHLKSEILRKQHCLQDVKHKIQCPKSQKLYSQKERNFPSQGGPNKYAKMKNILLPPLKSSPRNRSVTESGTLSMNTPLPEIGGGKRSNLHQISPPPPPNTAEAFYRADVSQHSGVY